MPTQATPAPLLTPREVAAHLRVHRASIYRWVATGQLPAYRLGGENGPLRISGEALGLLLRDEVPAERNDARPPPPAAAAARRGLQPHPESTE